MALKVRLHKRARQDLDDIRDYLLKHASARSAERVRAHLRTKIGRLATLPRMGAPTSDASIRILPPTRYPYRIYYTIKPNEVVVLHIRHAARRAPDDLQP